MFQNVRSLLSQAHRNVVVVFVKESSPVVKSLIVLVGLVSFRVVMLIVGCSVYHE
jgi:uncharacterized protein (UPF0548 family)